MPVTVTVTLVPMAAVTFVRAMSSVGTKGSEKVERELISDAVNSKKVINIMGTDSELRRDIAIVESTGTHRKNLKRRDSLKHNRRFLVASYTQDSNVCFINEF